MPDRTGEDLIDPPPPHVCDGGWRWVGEDYARHVTDPANTAALANTVYPCRTCRPQQFARWVQRHYSPGHDPHNCEGCCEMLGLKSRKAT